MTLAGISATEGQQAAGEVPVILGIALDDVSRRRLASLLEGAGVLMFTPDVATARALLDRQSEQEPSETEAEARNDESVVRIGDLEVDRVRCRVRWRGVSLALNKRERDLLGCMAADPARVWTYRQLHAAAWDDGYLDPGRVHAAIKRLRRRLRETGVPVRIDAVRGVGYEVVEADEHN